MTKEQIMEAIASNNIVAVWEQNQFCDMTGDYRSCLFVRIGSFEENNWCRFFPEEEVWETLPKELFDIAIEEE